VGNDGEQIVADSSTSTGLRYNANYAAGKNKFINGDLYQNQRNFTTTTSNDVFVADRWMTNTGNANVTFTTPTIAYASFTNQTSNKVVRLTATNASNDAGVKSRIEDVASFANQTVTVSAWFRSSATTYSVDFVEAMQYFGSGGSAAVYTYATVTGKTFGSSWTRLDFQITIPSIAGKTIGAGNYLAFRIDPTSAIANGEWLEMTHFQVEAGSVATAFQTATGTIQGELAACQRYYYQTNPIGNGYGRLGLARASSTTNMEFPVPLPVAMRIVPTTVTISNLTTTTANTITAVAFNQATTTCGSVDVTTSSVVSGSVYVVMGNNSTSAYIAFSAEL
jgi:hypothetical protein